MIEANQLAFRYRTAGVKGRAWTLEGLSFHVEASEIFGIVGPNGAGKSSLIKVLAGLIPLNKGQIRLRGKPLAQMTRPNRLLRSLRSFPKSTFHCFLSLLPKPC